MSPRENLGNQNKKDLARNHSKLFYSQSQLVNKIFHLQKKAR